MSGPAGGEHPEGGEPPLFPAAVHGLRSWRLNHNGLLHGIGNGRSMIWAPDGEPTNAICLNRSHPAPRPGCGCGLYALHPSKLCRALAPVLDPRTLIGLVEAWGRIEVHRRGFRAQHARPILFLVPPPHLARVDEARRLKQASERYGVPLETMPRPEHAREWCRLHGIGLSREQVRSLVNGNLEPSRVGRLDGGPDA